MPPYSKVNWKNSEAGGTPLSAANLDRMDQGIADLDAATYRKPASGIPGSDLAAGAVDFDELSTVEPAPGSKSVQAGVSFAAQMYGSYEYSGGWSRGMLAQDVKDDLTKAASAYQKPATGIPGSDIAADAAIPFSKLAGIPCDMVIVHSSGTRKTGNGDISVGVPIQRRMIVDSVEYQFGTADASGSTTVKLAKRKFGSTSTIQGTSVTISSVNQSDGNDTGAARTTPAEVNNTLEVGDRLVVQVESVGTTPGKILCAAVKGRYL
ncbi:hypothetical protein DEU38_1349 [Rhodococcus sp. AG1013]|uniref:hypothetical protein n=1 Tax=Rhodococcus sp. AG1013 TaxID=2183996 RepID=UPI000E0B9784|nr:hypothetical protein [Rhodococcus sp. AG1013]RDI13434.1 hypothetical protein DEU38_1349 [Rhodococcus sp. AG1013]